jgi:hypothetical protein
MFDQYSGASVRPESVCPESACPEIAVRFMLDVDADAGLLPRLLQPFAKRHLLPDRMWSHRVGATVHVEIAVAAMPAALAPIVEANLRQFVGVRNVTQVRPSAVREVA